MNKISFRRKLPIQTYEKRKTQMLSSAASSERKDKLTLVAVLSWSDKKDKLTFGAVLSAAESQQDNEKDKNDTGTHARHYDDRLQR